MAKRLPPLVERPDWYETLERELLKAIRRHVFLPLLREVIPHEPERVLENAVGDLVLAIGSGEIQYTRGHFEGRFKAAVSRELRRLGATYDRRRKFWTIAYADLPAEARQAIALSEAKFRAMAERANRALENILPEQIAAHIDMAKMFDTALFKMDQQFRRNVSKIGIRAELTRDQRRHIAENYTRSTRLDIEGWTRREITALRNKVHKNTFEYGIRRESLVRDIEAQYGVTTRKARFLARQETSLIMAEFQQKRYADAGIRRYIWKCVNNPPRWITGPKGGRRLAPHSVRPDHWELNDSVQDWARPPITDKRTGRRRHPKQDYNCRCTAIPIVE